MAARRALQAAPPDKDQPTGVENDMRVKPGIERIVESGLLDGLRVGVVCNPASVDADFRLSVDVLARADVRLGAIFGPQHGFRSDVQDNMIESPHRTEPVRQIPIYSLYSDTREPTAEMLAGLDALVIDLQDVGTRVYTYIYTMANCMRAARRHRVPVVVTDRPNPIGGERVEGPVLRSEYASFVGQFPIPLRHGMTIGELARLFNDAFEIGAKLEVMAMEGWSRSMYHSECGLPWVMPSPNIPTPESAEVYAGTVLFEGTVLSEGRGTTRPFELVGAPWIHAERFADEMNELRLRGAHFRPVVFEPTFHKHAGTPCGGCQIHVTDRQRYCAVEAAVHLLHTFRKMDPDRFGWRPPPYEYEHEKLPIDILFGSDHLRTRLDAGGSAQDIIDAWEPGLSEFQKVREDYLLY